MSTKLETVTIMDIPFVNKTYTDFIETVTSATIDEEKQFIVTANPEIVMATRKEATYKQIVQTADYVVPDGIGIIVAAKLQKEALQERIAGFDVMTSLLEKADAHKLSCFFLGASEAVNEKAVQQIQKTYPNLIVAGRHHGYFDISDAEVQEQVIASEADLVFVALGFPKQEKWIDACMPRCHKGTFIGVGGSFDVFAGNVKRAPDFWIKWNIEWLYRLLKQPFRWKRMLPIVKFLWLIVRKKG